MDSVTDRKTNWLYIVFQLEGSVFPKVLPRITFFSVFAVLVCCLQFIEYPKFVEHIGNLTNNVVYNLVLGLLLVFRTNTSYDRFWDGRKSLGVLVVNIRNFSRFVRLSIPENSKEDRAEKAAVLKLLAAFVVATKLQLRGQKADEQLKSLLNQEQQKKIDSVPRMSLLISLWIGEYLQQQLKKKAIDTAQRIELNGLLNQMVGGLSSCERIANTPLPIAYRIYLKRLIFIYCLGLPFRLVPQIQWLTILIVAIVSFILLGMEEVARELENPFLYGANDIPLNNLCDNIIGDLETIANFSSEELLPLTQNNLSLVELTSA